MDAEIKWRRSEERVKSLLGSFLIFGYKERKKGIGFEKGR